MTSPTTSLILAEKSAQHNFLQANLKHAKRVPVKSNPQAVDDLKMPGYRVVDGSYSHVVRHLRSRGHVAESIARAGIRSAVVPE